MHALVTDLKAGTDTNLISSIVILAVVAIFPFVQLIFYKVYQTEDTHIWIKWFEFLSYKRSSSIAIILVLGDVL